MTPADFIAWVAPLAQQSQTKTGVPASVSIAQAAIESAWGTRAPGNNLFGIKADPAWVGPTIDFLTHEVINGQAQAVIQKFRAYPTPAGSIFDHGEFLRANPRYAAAFQLKDGIDFAHEIAEAGYATDPNYGHLIETIIMFHDLEKFDS